jgi:hypothetical protein
MKLVSLVVGCLMLNGCIAVPVYRPDRAEVVTVTRVEVREYQDRGVAYIYPHAYRGGLYFYYRKHIR